MAIKEAIRESIKELTEKCKDILLQITEHINNLPDNENIKRISENPNCFIISSKCVIGNSISADYYDFKYQYKKIIEQLHKGRVEDIISKLEKYIKEGKIIVSNGKDKRGFNCVETIKLHPKVIEYLKQII